MNQIKKNEQLLKDYYTAFQNRDAQSMASYYHEQAQFDDPAFGKLNRDEVALMWQMLCRSSKDLRVKFQLKHVDETSARVDWEAFYSYGKSKRKVHNQVKASFKFQDDKILYHNDLFSLWKWARQAMGSIGLFIGWTKFFRNRLQQQSNDMLQRFLAKQKK